MTTNTGPSVGTSDYRTDVVTKLLGAAVNSKFAGTVGVIGEIDKSISGNSILRIGNYTYGQEHWVGGVAHVVLTPEERECLIAALVAHR